MPFAAVTCRAALRSAVFADSSVTDDHAEPAVLTGLGGQPLERGELTLAFKQGLVDPRIHVQR